MSNVALFALGGLVTLLVGGALALLVWGAILDGRDNEEQRPVDCSLRSTSQRVARCRTSEHVTASDGGTQERPRVDPRCGQAA